jgi:hypothetical protein
MAHLANKYFNDISHADVANTKCERSAHTAGLHAEALQLERRDLGRVLAILGDVDEPVLVGHTLIRTRHYLPVGKACLVDSDGQIICQPSPPTVNRVRG